jgi:hypothetical protein
MKIYALTTRDNPYSYFKEKDEWEAYENLTGNRALTMLGRFAYTSDQLSVEENEKEIERAIDEIIKYDPTNTFIKETGEIKEIWN